MKLRFSDSKWTDGKLKFFLSLCEKLKHDIGEFAEILAPSRKGFQQIIVKLLAKAKRAYPIITQTTNPQVLHQHFRNR